MWYFGSMRKNHWSDGELAQRSGRFLPSLLNLIVWQVAGQEPDFTSFYKMWLNHVVINFELPILSRPLFNCLVADPGYPNFPRWFVRHAPRRCWTMLGFWCSPWSLPPKADPTVSGWPGGWEHVKHVERHVQAMREIYYIWYSRCIYIICTCLYLKYAYHVYNVYMTCVSIYVYLVYICIYIYMICISMYSTCLSIYNTPKKDTNTSRNVGTWTLWGRHHQSTIVEALFGIFFWFTTLYRVQHDGFWAFCLWPWQIWMDGWHQPTAAICRSRSSWGFFDVLSLMNPFQTRTLAFISGFAPGRGGSMANMCGRSRGRQFFFLP